MPYPGYVYLLKSSRGVYKIGCTNNPERRYKTLSAKLPFDVTYECLIKIDDMDRLEQSLHFKFSKRQFCHEWFALNDDDVEYIKSLADGE